MYIRLWWFNNLLIIFNISRIIHLNYEIYIRWNIENNTNNIICSLINILLLRKYSIYKSPTVFVVHALCIQYILTHHKIIVGQRWNLTKYTFPSLFENYRQTYFLITTRLFMDPHRICNVLMTSSLFMK